MPFRHLSVVLAALAFASAAEAQERQWTLDASDQDAYLVFGVPDTDDVGVSLWCPIRQGVVNMFLPQGPEAIGELKEIKVTFKAGDIVADATGRTEVNADAGVASVETQMAVDAPLLDAMTKADRFHVIVAGDDRVYPLVEADVAGLLELCRTQ